MKKTKFLFDIPVTKDWLFWVFIVIASLSGISAFQGVMKDGGVNTSSFSVISGLIDGSLVIFSGFIWVVPIFLVRKLYRKVKNKSI